MRKIVFFFCLFCCSFSFSQENENDILEIDEILDELLSEDEIVKDLLLNLSKFNFIYTSVDFNSNTYFSGRDLGIDQFNIRPQLSYFHSSGFFGSVSGVYYEQFIPSWDYTNIAIGYLGKIKKSQSFRYSIFASTYLYSSNNLNPFKYTFGGSLNYTNKKRTFGTSLASTFLFGDDKSIQLTTRTYKTIVLSTHKKTQLKFIPQFIISAGEQSYELAQISYQHGLPIIVYTENSVFDIINTEFVFPLQLTSNDFEVELGYHLNLPSKIGDEVNLKSTNYLSLSIGYIFEL